MERKETEFAREQPVLAGPIPPSARLPFFQYIRTVRDNAIAGYHRDVFEQWIVEVKYWRIHTFIVNHPEGIKRVLVDNADNYVKGGIEPRIAPTRLGKGFAAGAAEGWQERRRTMTSSLDMRSILGDSSAFEDATRGALDRWQSLPPGTVLDLPAEMARITGEIIFRIVFSSASARFERIMERLATRYQGETVFDPLDFVPLLDLPWRLHKRHRQRRKLRELNQSIDRLIEERRGAEPGGDFLGWLLKERNPQTGAALSADEVKSQVVTVLGSGHDTVALALGWIWYLLARHPLQEARLHAELDRVLGGRAPVFADLANLPFARMVVEETLRLYPPIHTLPWRGAVADDEVCGVKIPKGATVSIVPWVLHRHAKLWDDPLRFDPERFSPARSSQRPRYAYLPFGAGPRVCIGAQLAMAELMLILAALAQRYQLRLAPGQKLEPQGLISLKARHGMKVTLERRG